MPVTTHKCPVDACKRQIPSHLLMCGSHWFKVPKGLRLKVLSTYAAGQTGEYLATRQAAINAANKTANHGQKALI